MNDTHNVLLSEANRVLTIAWNRPEKKNALTQAMYTQAADALLAAQVDSNVRVVMITGTADCFTAGNDVADFLNNPATSADSPVVRFLETLIAFEKPLVAAVNGAAVGVGTTMLLHCDVVVAADTTVFALPFAKLGLCPEAGSSYLLPLLAGHQRAAELLLLGDNFDAAMAKECGIINRVAQAGNYLEVATELAVRLAVLPPDSLRTTKALMKQAQLEGMQPVFDAELVNFGRMLTSPAAEEAMTAFMQRRAPDFSRF